MSPAKSSRQLRMAYHAAEEGEEWGKKMVRDTPDELKKRMMTGTHPKKGKKSKKSKSKKHSGGKHGKK